MDVVVAAAFLVGKVAGLAAKALVEGWAVPTEEQRYCTSYNIRL